MGIASDIHNAGMKFLTELLGWQDVYIMMNITTGDPFAGGTTTVRKAFQVTALISKNESAYQKADINNNKEFKLCKIPVDSIVAINTAQGVNIPIPPDGSLKADKRNIAIKVTNGLEYQIKVEGTGSFDGRDSWVLEIERDS